MNHTILRLSALIACLGAAKAAAPSAPQPASGWMWDYIEQEEKKRATGTLEGRKLARLEAKIAEQERLADQEAKALKLAKLEKELRRAGAKKEGPSGTVV